MTDAITGSFHNPFAEQIAALRLRMANLVGTVKWDDLVHAQHDRAFMVAGAMKADLLDDLAKAVLRSIEEGTGLEAFRKDFRSIVEKHGWHGWTGEGTAKGEAWRTRVIYRTNMATSYAAGRMAQLVAGKFAYWVYFHGNSKEPRHQHLAWDGIALPPDHPFWKTHYPPNGWGCSCYASGARTAAGVKRLGGNPDKPLPDGWQAMDPRTGTEVGISKGWGYAPGASVAQDVVALRDKLEVLSEPIATNLIQSLLTATPFDTWFAAPSGVFPMARLSEGDAALVGSNQRVAVMSAESAEKQLAHHPDLNPADYARVQEVVDHPTLRVQQDPRRLMFIQEVPDAGGYVLVVKAVVEKGELFIVSFRRMSRDEATRDRDIRTLLGKGGLVKEG